MTYGQFLILFLLLPIIMLTLLIRRGWRQKQIGGERLQGWTPLLLLSGLTIVAIVYTFPWDSHLIATRIWWYGPSLVSGITLISIPLEEALFFPLQTALVGLWFLLMFPRSEAHAAGERTGSIGQRIRRLGRRGIFDKHGSAAIRVVTLTVGIALWLAALNVLRVGWQSATYLGWELVWALPPLIVQVGLGGDILWKYKGRLSITIIPIVVYLSVADTIAIHEGIWTINQHRSIGIYIWGQLPLEEFVFFLLTTTLVAFGLTLGLAPEFRKRLRKYLALFPARGSTRQDDTV